MTDASESPNAPALRVAANNEGPVAQWSPGSYSLLSILVPGAGQFAQRRFVAGALQLVTVATYLVTAVVAVNDGRALLLALAWNVWSAIDAYWHAPYEVRKPDQL